MPRNLFLWFISGLLSVISISASYAEVNISFWPITQVIQQTEQNSTLWLQNIGKNNAELQFTVYAWGQQQNKDFYQDQQTITVAPPMIGILPNEKRVIRLILNGKRPTQEQAYRLVIDEIPVASAASEKVSNDSQLSIHMRYVLPLFVEGSSTPSEYIAGDTGSAKAVPTLYWRLITKQQHTYLEIKNSGPVHARLSDMTFIDPKTGKHYPLNNGLFGYILSGSTMQWEMTNLPKNAQKLQLSAAFFDSDKLYSLQNWQ